MAAQPTSAITFQNFFSATLTGDITASSTDILLDNVPNGSEGFLVIEPDSTTNHEVIYYTSKTALKVVCPSAADGRGQDDTTAVSHSTGAAVIMAPIAAYFETLLNLFTTTPQGWTALSGTFTSPTYSGNLSYSFTTSVDQTAIVSRGMRLRTARTVAAPTQCTDLESSSSQYYSKTSPAGMTFTDDFVVSAWIKVESYPASNQGIISSRYNGTSGWQFDIDTSGRVRLIGFNAGAANLSYVTSYQSVPLNRWVHVAGQLDMSAFTATTTTSYIMVDGVDVPATVQRGGTNPTALIQAGDLQIGAGNSLTFFDGKIAQVAIYSAKVTQANVRATISQGLIGTETSLISAYSFNNVITDLNGSNANNLTANGSAVATNADSPFCLNDKGTPGGTYDFAVVTDVTASTITVETAQGSAIPVSGGIAGASYSTQAYPFGFPGGSGFGSRVAVVAGSSTTTSTTPANLADAAGPSVTVNIGREGRALVSISAVSSHGSADSYTAMTYAVTGATTLTGTANIVTGKYSQSRLTTATAQQRITYSGVTDNLLPGSNTFTANFFVGAGTGTWSLREISVTPL